MSKLYLDNIQTIATPGSGYAGWPTLAKSHDGQWLAVYSGGRRHHVCPFGQTHFIRSCDQGKTWTWPRVLVDNALDDRDAGVLQTSTGTLIVTWFSSLCWEWVMEHQPVVFQSYPKTEQAEWQRRHALLNDEIRHRELGAWCLRSTDNGASWSGRIPTLVNSPHGPCELSDGRLLYVGKKVRSDGMQAEQGSPFSAQIGVAHSTDQGASWQMIADIAPLPQHQVQLYHELHAVEAADGTIIAHIRNHNTLHQHETLQIESSDGGYSWSAPHSTGIWGYPAFLLRSESGKLITTVGHRREPSGNQIAISDDCGKSWSRPIPINTDSQADFGYPSTIEWAPNSFASLWYDRKNSQSARLRLARWHLA